LDRCLKPVHWHFTTGDAADFNIDIWPNSVQEKLQVQSVDAADLRDYWGRHSSSLILAADVGQRLLESGNTALEAILDPSEISGQRAYLTSDATRGEEVAPADILTVWGDGRIDLNRCSLDLMRARLKGFTDAQLAGILQLRSQAPLETWDMAQKLDLSDHQVQELSLIQAFAPAQIELVIRLRKGGLSALYHAVVDIGTPGRVLEVRPIY
jgi:hypothetical protein